MYVGERNGMEWNGMVCECNNLRLCCDSIWSSLVCKNVKRKKIFLIIAWYINIASFPVYFGIWCRFLAFHFIFVIKIASEATARYKVVTTEYNGKNAYMENCVCVCARALFFFFISRNGKTKSKNGFNFVPMIKCENNSEWLSKSRKQSERFYEWIY